MKSCGILSFPFFHFSFLEKISSFAVTVDGFMGKHIQPVDFFPEKALGIVNDRCSGLDFRPS